MILIRGGVVLTTGGWKRADVTVEGQSVSAIGLDLDGDEVIDADGCLVGPGFVDLHTHLREPGQTWKEDIATGSAAAVAGGFTAITAMPNTDPPMDTPKIVESVVAIADEIGITRVVPSAALTKGRSGTSPTDVDELYEAGVRLFTDDGDSVSDADVLQSVMEVISDLPGAFVAQHAEDANLTLGGHMHEGEVSARLGVGGMPSAAETDIVARDLEVAERTGVHYHCQHVSAMGTVALIRAAKEADMKVTAEVTPHHLTFDESSLTGLDPNFKMYPPLRSEGDRHALVTGLEDGTIDAVATDHAPHLPDEKDTGFDVAPRGVIGLETAASAAWEVLGDRDLLFKTLSQEPARILGLDDQGQPLQPGGIANLVVFDPESVREARGFRSKSSNSPYRGREMKGRVVATMYRGRMVHEDGAR